MVYHFLLCLTTLIFDVFTSIRLEPDEKDLQIALLRQQLRVLERKMKKKPRLSRPEKLMLVALTTHVQRQTQRWQQRLREAMLLVQPETVLKWHRELVRRKWTFRRPNHGGCPKLDCEIEALIFQIARENPRMGYDNYKVSCGSLPPSSIQRPSRTSCAVIVSCPRHNAVGVRGGRF